jgi:hypothetical protein
VDFSRERFNTPTFLCAGTGALRLVSDFGFRISAFLLSVGFWVLSFGEADSQTASPQLPAVAVTNSAVISSPGITNGPAPNDPLYNLMLSQPRIDIDSPVIARASFDPSVVAVGQKAFYRVTFNALDESVEWPAKLAAPKELSLTPGARGQILQFTGPAFVPLSCFNTHVRASTPGDYAIPAFVVQVYGKPVNVPATTLHVAPANIETASPLQPTVEIPRTNVFVGQPLAVRVVIPGPTPPLQGVQLTGPGLLVDQGAVRQQIVALRRGGTDLPSFTYDTTITAVESGPLSFYAQAFAGGNRIATPITIQGGQILFNSPTFTLLESEPLHVFAQPVPRAGRLPGFTGAIGKLAIISSALDTNSARVGDSLHLSVSIQCDTNILRLVAPPAPRVPDWQIFASTTNVGLTQPTISERTTTFTYTLIPLSEQSRSTPSIPFSYFDPDLRAYRDLSIPSLPVSIEPGLAPAEVQAMVRSERLASEPEEQPVLSGLARTPGPVTALLPAQQSPWFLVGQILPASAFFGLWAWDRRRRFYELHPDVLLRRRARRALRRERKQLRRAVQARDAQSFAVRAIAAMSVACAPHYPAEPRALVAADIVQLLPENDRAGQSAQLIRRFFTSVDASRYSDSAVPDDLLSLHPDLEQLLTSLEARL